jgi:cysteine desulfurase
MNTPDTAIFLDYASTTPLDTEVLEAMLPYYQTDFYNPNSLYSGSVQVRRAIEESRKQIADALKARSLEIYFIDGGTEANNLAIIGSINEWQKQHLDKKPNIITTSIEHSSVLAACEASGAELRYLDIDEQGVVVTRKLRELIDENTVLVTVGMANNEIGVLQDIRAIAKEVRHYRKHQNSPLYPLFHTDAVQAVNYLELDTRSLGVDMLTIAASKFYGPKKIACLYIRDGIRIESMIKGGEQERGLRAGTENVPAIIGMARAMNIAVDLREQESDRLWERKEQLLSLISGIPGVTVNGSYEKQTSLPNILNFSVEGLSGEELLLRLDAQGFAVATRSACSSNSDEESHVLRSLKPQAEILDDNLRVSMGRGTTTEQIKLFAETLKTIIEKIRKTKEIFTQISQ